MEFRYKMIKQFRKAVPFQFFLSDTFDEINNNWGLKIIPMGYDH